MTIALKTGIYLLSAKQADLALKYNTLIEKNLNQVQKKLHAEQILLSNVGHKLQHKLKCMTQTLEQVDALSKKESDSALCIGYSNSHIRRPVDSKKNYCNTVDKKGTSNFTIGSSIKEIIKKMEQEKQNLALSFKERAAQETIKFIQDDIGIITRASNNIQYQIQAVESKLSLFNETNYLSDWTAGERFMNTLGEELCCNDKTGSKVDENNKKIKKSNENNITKLTEKYNKCVESIAAIRKDQTTMKSSSILESAPSPYAESQKMLNELRHRNEG
ncbi:hypothetical protein [Biostraticola tofi]|uniref:Uncharacterized protein n=1 Tax=Biostraticola tofi TaxID=466109 RepID=A0A4R3YH19_9GAMM|nr:hypothetical protein [Biostraticola tofi]TCV91496.1 hypothetical protein EDC52_11720 [Biostraticola tofi]